MDRNLDGMYFRIKRNDEWKNVCFSDLTHYEKEEICKDRPVDWYKHLAYHLADCLKTIGDEFDIEEDCCD